MMKTATSELKALLHSGEEFFIADLYTLMLSDGTVVGRFTSADVDLTVGGNVFYSKAAQIKRGQVTNSTGIDVDSLDVSIYVNERDTILGQPMVHAFRAGIMDNGIFKCEVLFLPDWNDTSIPPVLHFFGRISIKELSAIEIDLEVRSETEMLDIELPRHTTVPACIHQVYEEGCDLNKDVIGINSTVALNSNVLVIKCGLTQAAGWFDLGVILFTDGLNNSIRRTIRSYKPGVITMVFPIPYTPQVGDHFVIYPGCDGTINTCVNKFNNLSHFRGCPFVPTPETIY